MGALRVELSDPSGEALHSGQSAGPERLEPTQLFLMGAEGFSERSREFVSPLMGLVNVSCPGADSYPIGRLAPRGGQRAPNEDSGRMKSDHSAGRLVPVCLDPVEQVGALDGPFPWVREPTLGSCRIGQEECRGQLPVDLY